VGLRKIIRLRKFKKYGRSMKKYIGKIPVEVPAIETCFMPI